MSDKKHKFDGDTFQQVIMQTMQNGSLSQSASKLIENFDETQKAKALKPVHDVSTIADILKMLAEKLSEQENEDV